MVHGSKRVGRHEAAAGWHDTPYMGHPMEILSGKPHMAINGAGVCLQHAIMPRGNGPMGRKCHEWPGLWLAVGPDM